MKYVNKQGLLLLLFTLPFLVNAQKHKSSKGDFYEVTVYHFTKDSQAYLVSNHLEKELMPSLHAQGLVAGVFQPIANDTAADKTMWLIVQHASWKKVLRSMRQSVTDVASPYTDAAYDAPPFARKEVMVAAAFPMAKKLVMPKLTAPKTDRVYEWRSYESATEKIHRNKVQMFNEGGEVALFSRLNFNAVFYAAVVVGRHMPNLIYMTSFENMDDRNEHWKTFSSDPEWKKLSAMPEYQHNVSKADIILMKALPYSDF